MANADLELFLARPVRLGKVPGRTAHVDSCDGEIVIEFSSPGAQAAFQRLVRRGGSRIDLTEIAARGGGAVAAREWKRTLTQLESGGAIGYAARAGRVTLLRAVPVQRAYDRTWKPVVPRGRVLLSRFAHVRRDGRQWILESPLSFVRVEVGPGAVRILERLAQPATAATLAVACRISVSACRDVLRLLQAGGFLTRVGRAGRTAEDADRALVQWEFADLIMQHHSRVGRHDGVVGATYQFTGRYPPEPPTKPVSKTRAIPLFRPNIAALMRNDEPLTRVLERRTSIRDFGTRPITVRRLGEFLFRAARVRQTYPVMAKRPYAFTSRPYPSGGACYPLEIYVVCGHCNGLPAGIYHYDPVAHALRVAGGDPATVQWLLDDARASQGLLSPAQLLFVFTARFRRLTWKYRSIALATILKDVGVLLQTMYLVATAMRLAPGAIGSGDSTRFGAAIGARFEDESSVGEFLLGSAPD